MREAWVKIFGHIGEEVQTLLQDGQNWARISDSFSSNPSPNKVTGRKDAKLQAQPECLTLKCNRGWMMGAASVQATITLSLCMSQERREGLRKLCSYIFLEGATETRSLGKGLLVSVVRAKAGVGKLICYLPSSLRPSQRCFIFLISSIRDTGYLTSGPLPASSASSSVLHCTRLVLIHLFTFAKAHF